MVITDEEYFAGLRDVRWFRLRDQRFIIDNYICQWCYATDNRPVEGHHVAYVKGRHPWEYDVSEILTVCRTCHARDKANRYNLIGDVMRALKNSPMSDIDIAVILQIVSGKKRDQIASFMRKVFAMSAGINMSYDEYVKHGAYIDCR